MKIPKFLGYLSRDVDDTDEYKTDWFENIDKFTETQARMICDVISEETVEVDKPYPDDLFEMRFLTNRGVQYAKLLDN